MLSLLGHKARFLVTGLDTMKETFNVRIRPQVLEELEKQKELAAATDFDGAATFALGGESCHMGPCARGVKFFIRFEGFDLHIRHMSQNWPVSIVYGSAGLWLSGVDLLRSRALDLLAQIGGTINSMVDADGVVHEREPREWQRLSEVHVSMDFHSELLTDQMQPGIERFAVMHAGVKRGTWGANERHETLTLGSKGSVQIQVYDKGREIREASGKTWMKEIWEREGGKRLADLEHIWRVECRLAKDWLQERGVDTYQDFLERRAELLQDCLFHRRLTRPDGGDSNRARWPMHWLWQACMLAACGEVIARPLGLRLIRDSEALPDQLKKTAAGCIRAAAMAHAALNPHERRNVDDLIRDAGRDVQAILFQDQHHSEKTALLKERYRRIALPK